MTTTTADQSPALLDIVYTVEDGISATTTVKVNGTAVDWTGATFEAQVRRGQPAVGTDIGDLTVTGNASGVLTITATGTVTDGWGEGAFPYSILATFTGDQPLTYVAGTLRGTLRATHN